MTPTTRSANHLLHTVDPVSNQVDETESDSESSTSSVATSVEAPTLPSPPVMRTTKQKRDWRPKSTWHLKPMAQRTWFEKICTLALIDEGLHGMSLGLASACRDSTDET